MAVVSCAALTACAAGDSGSSSSDEVTVGVVTSVTGTFATQAVSFEDGFRAGLDYATDGTGEVDGKKVKVVVKNDNADPATGISATKELLGQGAKFITGPTSSAVAVPAAELSVQNGATFIGGASGTSELVGMDANVFEAGGGTVMSNQAILASLGDDTEGKTMVYVGQDYAYGQDAAKQLAAAGKRLGITVESILLPPSTQDFTPAMAKLANLEPDIVYVGWQGTGSSQLFAALADQNIFGSVQVTSPLTTRSAWPSFAEAAGDSLNDITLSSSYFEGAADGNDIEKAMIDYAKKSGTEVDYVHPIGFVAAQMVVRAIEESGGDLTQEAVSKALSGWEFESPIGPLTIRAEDHLITVPEYDFKLEKDGANWVPKKLAEYAGQDIQPPVEKKIAR